MPKSRRREKSQRAHARATQAAQHRAEERRTISYRRHRLRRILGWSLVVLGGGVVSSHWLTHLQVWDFASQGIEDLLAGYPMGAALGVGGAIVLSKPGER